MAASGASNVLTAGSHNAAAFGIVTNWSLDFSAVPAPLREQGKMLPSAIGMTEKNFAGMVTYIAGAGLGFIAPGTKGALSFTVADNTGGGSKAYSGANMKCFGTALAHQDRTFAVYTSVFICEDSADTTTPGVA